ncbi:hypothetical protein [Pelagicoccus sp. SDUM812003]|uniref:hypothetical protein n=1 Tax=Pelagicoccus sp. SDUM812003 TaxID=3041267 RepID=UPI00280E057D|nr:hypothetical protein [Pelagicoccus sp. SDUM812003]MDQ8205771.1 hypothetical protein [Pelagicoccus sp. SDUM812003]
MSTVIWTIVKTSDKTISDETDHLLIYKHASKLDKLCSKLGVANLSSFHDNTDLAVNLMDELADEDVETYKRKNEKWHDISKGIESLESLIQHLERNEIKFGLFDKASSKEMIVELSEVRNWLAGKKDSSEGFHLCVVM